MLYINQKRRLNPEESFVLLDFDRTLTTFDSTITWGLLEESPLIDPNYRRESITLYQKYRPIEIDTKIPYEEKARLMVTWWQDTASLLSKYHIYEKTMKQILSSSHGLTLRKDSLSFLKRMEELEVPVIIVSAGLGNLIEEYLKRMGVLSSNITILSNFFLYDQDRIIGIKESLIHALNKDKLEYPSFLKGKTGLLFGDQIEDQKMGTNLDTINIGFCDIENGHLEEYMKSFDAVLTGDTSFDTAAKVYMKRYEKKERCH